MANDRIVYERAGERVAVLRLNCPDRLNAMDRAAIVELHRLVGEIARDEALRVVIITGTGRAFSAGADLTEMDSTTRQEVELYQDITRRMVTSPVVFIAAINGIAVGVGAELSLASDIRIGSEAAEVMFAEATRGLFATNGVMHFLPRVVGHGCATQWLLTGERVAASALLRAGFITELVPADRLLPRARELAATIAANAPLSVGLIKQLLRRTWEVDLETMLQHEVDGVMTCMASDDMKEGLRAFVQKRPPVWKGS